MNAETAIDAGRTAMAGREPLVSVVLPTYNRADRLRTAIENVLGQTYGSMELIVVDDGSTDCTRAVVAEVHDARVRYLWQPNGKLPRALNTGFRAANGRYLTWTSDDNYYHPTALQRMAAFLEENRDVGFVYTDYNLVNEITGERRVVRVEPPEHLRFVNRVGACFLYRRAVYETVGNYDPQAFLAEDYDYWIRVSKRFRMEPLHEVLYDFYIHPKSLTAQYEAEVRRCRLQVALRNAECAGTKATCHYRLARIELGDSPSAARRHAMGALRWQPWRLKAWGVLALSCLPRRLRS